VVDGDWEVPDSCPSEGELSHTDSDSDLYLSGPEDGELSEEEDIFPIGQPAEGWEEAERKLAGYSKTRVYKQKLSYHRNKEEIKRRRDEKIAQTSGIPVGEKPKPVYADILQYFKPSETLPSNIPIENQSRQSTSPYVAVSSLPSPERIDTLLPPPSWEPSGLLSTQALSPPTAAIIQSYIPPNFDDSFLASQSFEAEAKDLDMWLKKNKELVTGDWLLRVEC
jgi:hypothetical protein